MEDTMFSKLDTVVSAEDEMIFTSNMECRAIKEHQFLALPLVVYGPQENQRNFFIFFCLTCKKELIYTSYDSCINLYAMDKNTKHCLQNKEINSLKVSVK
jgi:hypothetical protein